MITQSPSAGKLASHQPPDFVAETCRICGGSSIPFDRALILGRHSTAYSACENCGFVQTGEPHWLDEAYELPIADSDVGLVSRSLSMAKFVAQLESLFLDPRGRILDFGGGYGITVRLLRDLGFDAWRLDPYCRNLFAGGFEAPAERDGEAPDFDLVTAFEVAEHLPNPMPTFQQLFDRAESLLFSTELVPEPLPNLGDWDYYAPDHGQHVAFYTRKSLEIIAAESGKRLYTNGRSLHLMTSRKLPAFFVNLALKRRLPWPVLRSILALRSPGHRSRLEADHRAALERAEKSPDKSQGDRSAATSASSRN